MGTYIPYMLLFSRDDKKLRAILDNNIPVNGLMIDIRRVLSKRSIYREAIVSLLEKNSSVVLLIDPRTDSFQVDSSIRSSKHSLQWIYKLIGIREKKEIENDDLFTPASLNDKIELLTDKILRVSKIPTVRGDIRPSYYIPPYFVASSIDDWYVLTIKAINYAINKYDYPILAPIAINTKFLSNRENIKRAINDYRQMDVEGYLILPYDLDEYRSQPGILENLVYLVMGFKGTDKKIFVHSAEFGNVLLSLGVDTIISGMCIRRTPKEPTIIEGISEIAQTEVHVYVYKIFNKLYQLKFTKLLQMFPEIYKCKCPVCRYYRDLEDYLSLPDEVDYIDMGIHYVYWKNIEAEKYSNNSNKLIEDLIKAKEILEEYNDHVAGKYFFVKGKRYEYIINNSYIDRWLMVLETFGHNDSISL